MDSLFELLILALFFLPFLGRGKKNKQGQKKKKKRRTRASRGQRAERRTPVAAGGDADAAADDPAAEMLPDDLWEVLTGEERPGASESGAEAPASEPSGAGASSGRDAEPWQAPDDETGDAGGDGYDWSGASWEPKRTPSGASGDADPAPVAVDDEAASLETIPEPDYPQVVSMESPPPAPEARHRRFHRQLEARKRKAAARRRKRRRRRIDLGLGSRDELQRAVVLREVLGPPKGLQF